MFAVVVDEVSGEENVMAFFRMVEDVLRRGGGGRDDSIDNSGRSDSIGNSGRDDVRDVVRDDVVRGDGNDNDNHTNISNANHADKDARDASIEALMDNFNSSSSSQEIQNEIIKARHVCAQSLNTLLNRGEALDKLNVLADELSSKVRKFKLETGRLGVGDVWGRVFLWMGVVVLVFIVYFIFLR